jgi:hypothetical protein
MIAVVSYDDVACTVERDAGVSGGMTELTTAEAFAAYSAQASAVAQPNNLQAIIVFVGDNNVALRVPCHRPGVLELLVGYTSAAELAQIT